MGQLPPTRIGQETLCPCRYGHFQSLVAMGTAETPEERQAMGARPLLWEHRKPKLALLRNSKRQGRKNHPQLALPGLCNTNNPVHKDQGGIEPLRPEVGTLFGNTPWRQ